MGSRIRDGFPARLRSFEPFRCYVIPSESHDTGSQISYDFALIDSKLADYFQTAPQAYIITVADLCAIHAKRVTIQTNDIQLVEKFRITFGLAGNGYVPG